MWLLGTILGIILLRWFYRGFIAMPLEKIIDETRFKKQYLKHLGELEIKINNTNFKLMKAATDELNSELESLKESFQNIKKHEVYQTELDKYFSSSATKFITNGTYKRAAGTYR